MAGRAPPEVGPHTQLVAIQRALITGHKSQPLTFIWRALASRFRRACFIWRWCGCDANLHFYWLLVAFG